MEKELCLSEKKWGPIIASLYVTNENTITVNGVFHDEEKHMDYPGPNYEVGKIPQDLIAIKTDTPHMYVHTKKWQTYIRGLWKIVQDNPWFRYA